MASVSGSSTLSADSSANHKSDVWQYFNHERKKAKCQLCSKELAFHSGTTNLHEHLMNRHSGSYKGDGVKKKKQGILQAFARPKRCQFEPDFHVPFGGCSQHQVGLYKIHSHSVG